MNNYSFIGEIQTGYDSYTQRTDDFIKTFSSKITAIDKICKKHDALPIIIGGIKERSSDLHNLAEIITILFPLSPNILASKRKHTPIYDVLNAASCFSKHEVEGFVNCDNQNSLASIVHDAENPVSIIYTGNYEDLVTMESSINEWINDGKINSVITNSRDTSSNINNVFCVNPLFRSKINSPKPQALLFKNGKFQFIEIQHDEHVFYFEESSYEESPKQTSDFVNRLKIESESHMSDTHVMDSQKNLDLLITDFANKQGLSETSLAIVKNLMTHTNK